MTVVVVTFNALELLRNCLRSVFIQRYPGILELIVADNHSTDGTRSYLLSLQREAGVQVMFHSRNLGFSGAANRVLRKIHSPWVLFLDDDAVMDRDCLRGLLEVMRDHPAAGIIGCKQVWENGYIHCAEVELPWVHPAGYGEKEKGQRDYVRGCEAVSGACFLTRRAVFDRIGLFDERFHPCQYEDVDFCIRARQAGFQVFYNGSVRAVHANLYRSRRRAKQNRKLLEKKWGFRNYVLPEDAHAVDQYHSQIAPAFEKNDFSRVLGEGKRVLPHHPVPSYVYYDMGRAYLALGRWGMAARFLSRTVSDDRLPGWLRALASMQLEQARSL